MKWGITVKFSDLLSVLRGSGVHDWGAAPFSDKLTNPGTRSFSRLPSPSRTIFVALFPYYVEGEEHRNISRYAVSKDYHLLVKPYLERAVGLLAQQFPSQKFVSFVDSSPILEVLAAATAGLGVIGTNGTLLSPHYGSFVFIGEIVTDLEVDCLVHPINFCENCGRCRAACPTGALTDRGIDVSRCLSDITQRKGTFSPEEQALFLKGDLLWGCDRCQDVCPYNRGIPPTYLPEFYKDRRPYLTQENVLHNLSERAYGWRGQAVILRNISEKTNGDR